MVERPGITAPEIAQRYDRSLDTVTKEWTRDPDWPSRIGKRGAFHEYDPDLVEGWVRDHVHRPPVPLEPSRLYTAQELENAGIGITASTVRSDRSRGRWPAPDRTDGRTHMWYGSTVTRTLATRRRRSR